MKLVYVEWDDAHGVSPGWEFLADLRAARDIPCVVKSVGYLLHKDKNRVIIIPHLAAENTPAMTQGCGDMTIPKRGIIKMVELKMPEKSRSHEATKYPRKRTQLP